MAKVAVNESIAARAGRCLALQRELAALVAQTKAQWSAQAMRKAAWSFYPPERLQEFRVAIDRSPDHGGPALAALAHRITTFLIDPHRDGNYQGFLNGKVFSGWMVYRAIGDEARDAVMRYGRGVHEFYALLVVEAADRTPEVFGTVDDPAGRDARLAAVAAEVQSLKDGLNGMFTSEDLVLRQEIIDGRTLYGRYYACTDGKVALGDVDGLLGYLRAHQAGR